MTNPLVCNQLQGKILDVFIPHWQTLKIICVSGVIGIGKTSIFPVLKKVTGDKTIVVNEPWQKVRALPKFYTDKKRYAFQTQIGFYLKRANALMTALLNSFPGAFIITERTVWDDFEVLARAIYEMGYMEPEEWMDYSEMFRFYFSMIPLVPPTLFVWVMSSNNMVAQDGVKERGRTIEFQVDGVTNEYNAKLHKAHERFFSGNKVMVSTAVGDVPVPFVVVDRSLYDYVRNPRDEEIVKRLFEDVLHTNCLV